jgi:predicted dinucleotide-utilizing enzyme
MKIILIGAGFIAAFVTWHVHGQNKDLMAALDKQRAVIEQQKEQLQRDERIMSSAIFVTVK